MEYLNRSGIKHEKPEPRGEGRCVLYHKCIEKKWWTEAVSTAAWIINRMSNSVTAKTSYEFVYCTKPQLKNIKVFGALGYANIPDEKRRKLDAKAFKCRFMGYEDGVSRT
ncbi:hypothetical protein PC129_g24553 [Phytophthora cactorum]|uniref:Retroviral polymerase SH3-like domain-containing protein n=1 Tax=Phytophthora cactorum TaxID=29920 RepID=A0A329RL02_9STRA|nr:hypothetical protein PC114_g27735 [Phytophthora cactorum]KAG2956865.1 hypothetical protein PC119_g27531 [Phytophthora cactorum]KAG3044206.1 hypothetical protein PC122_g24905 [Phytophthora cactorum]KAG3122625.1 hypothetical protein PC128_g27740 [Phytophthora cactorum]KAG3197294.1 hypothetical protein PC129_g24553 [Phytophthora cactorum]